MLSGRRILLGVTGGIAAYKSVYLLRALQKAGAEVRVAMTPSATRFVGSETFSTLSGHPAAIEIFPGSDEPDAWTRHIEWGSWADLFVIAPCTANTLAKIAHGLSDNMLTATVLAARCPLLICPTMDGDMYEAPAMKGNLQLIRDYGYHLMEPESGFLASGLQGKGRLPETEAILETIGALLSRAGNLLAGQKIVVTAGPTREHIDPVRFISNPSSGKMGFAMAEAARDLGGEVTLIHGPVSLPLPVGMQHLAIGNASELFEAVKEQADADIIIMAAAVSDFTPAQKHEQKVKKTQADTMLELKSTPDILQWLGEHRRDKQTLIGFAMETEKLLENAQAKLKKKKADWIVANSLSEAGSGFAVDTNNVHVIGRERQFELRGTKKEVAHRILRQLFSKKTES